MPELSTSLKKLANLSAPLAHALRLKGKARIPGERLASEIRARTSERWTWARKSPVMRLRRRWDPHFVQTTVSLADKRSKMRANSVLLIEDDPDYARFVSAVLSHSGGAFEIRAAPTLRSGLDTVRSFRPDVILLDLGLPDCSGPETFRCVKAHAPETPIVVLTANDDEATALQAAEDGVQDYLVKGLQQPRVIARCVKMALRRHARHNAGKSPAGHPEIYFG